MRMRSAFDCNQIDSTKSILWSYYHEFDGNEAHWTTPSQNSGTRDSVETHMRLIATCLD